MNRHMKKVIIIFWVAMMLFSCESSIPNVESMDFKHEKYMGEFSYSQFVARYEGEMPDYVKNLEDIKYEKQELTTAALAMDYLMAVMADESTPVPLRRTGGIIYDLRYDPTAGIWCATVTTQEYLDELNDKYGENFLGSVGPLVYFRYDGKFLYLEPQE